MRIENKFPENASNANNLEIELFRNKYTNKVSYRNELGIIKELEFSASSSLPIATTTSIWANGFRIVGCIGQDIILPTNTNVEFTGPLSMCVGSTLTVPVGTTLTVV